MPPIPFAELPDRLHLATQARQLLQTTDPFSYLPEKELERIVAELSLEIHSKGTQLFLQGHTRVQQLYILFKGAAQRYYEQNNQKTMIGFLGEGDSYGGISILLNESISVRSLQVIEEATFFLLDRQLFLELCRLYPTFSEYFTDTFGKRMMDRSYAAIIAKTVRAEGETFQFFNQLVKTIYNKKVLFGDKQMTIKAAAEAMRSGKSSFIFINSETGNAMGILTERDLTRKVIAAGIDTSQLVETVMSTPLLKISEHALVIEALMTMLQTDVRHLAVENGQHEVVAVLSQREFLVAQGHSHLFLIREITQARSVDDIISCQRQIPRLVRALITNGANAANINRFITAVTDATTKRVLELVVEKMGPPPRPFAFMVMGSEGRREQTLKTDQDNAIIYADGDPVQDAKTHAYFIRLGETVCNQLDQVGYTFCPGEIMARNPKWCQSFSVWKGYFTHWIRKAEPEDLLQASIFFDFRWAYGDEQLVRQLREHLFQSLEGWSGFFRHLTENALHFKPPLGFFRNFVVESKGEHRNAFDIKSAMTPIVDFARIYALKQHINETNTLRRLSHLRSDKTLKDSEYEELEKGYSFLMQLRFVRQVTAILDEKNKADNYINPKKLTHIEQTMLKEIFRRVEKFQSKMMFDFIGIG